MPSKKKDWEEFKAKLPPLRMADPGQRMDEDAIEEGVPNRRLVLCGVSKTAALVFYEQGGYVGTQRIAVFRFEPSVGASGALLDGFDARTLDDIRNAIHRRRYQPFKKSFQASPKKGRLTASS